MRRLPNLRTIPAAVWIFLPLALGVLYAGAHALLAPQPTLENLPPPEAVLVQRFRNLDTLDRASFGPRGPQVRPVREIIADERNVPRLPGVDHRAPIHLILLPRGSHQDASMAVFRVSDPKAFEQAFMHTEDEVGRIRRAQHLHIQGEWAAVGPSRDATRRVGRGDLTCEDLGEDYSLAADIPGLVRHAMQVAKQYPWRGVLEALGVEPHRTIFVQREGQETIEAVVPGAQRVERIRTAWQTVRMWGWLDEGRIRVDLLPAAGALRELLAEQSEAPAAELPAPPSDAQAWLHVPTARGVRVLANALLACGVRLVPETEGADLLGGLGAARGGVLLWATRGLGTGFAWTLGLTARSGELPPLGAFLPPLASAPTELPADSAPITKGDTQAEREAPAGSLAFAPGAAAPGGAIDIVTFGPSARAALEGMTAHLATGPVPIAAPDGAGEPGEGMALVAAFFLAEARASQVLDRALRPGGFLAPLAGGDVRGALYTDGRSLRLLLWKSATP
ncbi:MAG: hypothetical protein O2894_06240 [Planctomycetota bacterium]|nr:hypothetical protein [Planctomycetota bacterium]